MGINGGLMGIYGSMRNFFKNLKEISLEKIEKIERNQIEIKKKKLHL